MLTTKFEFYMFVAAYMYSRVTLANPKDEEIIKQVFWIWIAYFDSLDLFLDANGDTISNYLFKEINETFKMEQGWQILNYLSVMDRLKDTRYCFRQCKVDVEQELDIALACNGMQKGSLQNVGFSHNQVSSGTCINRPYSLPNDY